jgi:hypothetical protein
MTAAIIVINVIRGTGDGTIAGIHKCSVTDRFLYLFVIVIAIVLTIVAILIIKKEHAAKRESGYIFATGDFEFSPKYLIKTLTTVFLCGVFGGLGLGTGPILNP